MGGFLFPRLHDGKQGSSVSSGPYCPTREGRSLLFCFRHVNGGLFSLLCSQGTLTIVLQEAKLTRDVDTFGKMVRAFAPNPVALFLGKSVLVRFQLLIGKRRRLLLLSPPWRCRWH
jgi:hypothetical protein